MYKKAFTLVELMVAMAIIAVLLAMTVFGISAAQRVLRDNQRRKAVEDISLSLNQYLSEFASYPAGTDVDFSSGTQVDVGGNYMVPLNGVAKFGGCTDASQSDYFYDLVTDGYILCTQLESGEIYNQGTASETCGANDVNMCQ